MVVESASYTSEATISATIDGKSYSSIPATPGNRHYDAIIASGIAITPYAQKLPTQGDYSAAIQAHIDATAKARGYADGWALAGYVSSTVPSWVAEATTFVAWRDQVWLYVYEQLAAVQYAQRSLPTIDGFILELPPITWPS